MADNNQPSDSRYCINCKYALDTDVCRRDLKTDLHANTKACVHFVKSARVPTDPDVIPTLGTYRDNAELAIEVQKISQIYYDESRNFWLWQRLERYYKRIDETDILSTIHKLSGKYILDYTKKEIIEAIKITGRERVVKPVPMEWIHCKDYVYNYKTGEQFKATPEYFYPAPIPHKIGLDEATPTIDKLFKDWMGEDAIKLYEICAYCLLDAYPIHRMFILFGRGRNGKGQFLNFLERFIGSDNTVSTDLELLCESRFESSKLYKMKLATIGETDFNAIKNTGKLKMLTGDDKIGGEFKGKDLFSFHNTAKIVIASNGLPESMDKSDGFNSRVIVLEFKNQFDEGKSIIESIPEIEYENMLLKCLKILPDLLDVRGRFTNEGTIEEKGKKYESLSNPFPTFKEQELIESSEDVIKLDVIRERYSMFLIKIHHRPTNYTAFTQTLHKNGYVTGREYINGHQERVVYGLKLKPAHADEKNIEIHDDDKSSKSSKTPIPTQSVYRGELESAVLPVLPVLPLREDLESKHCLLPKENLQSEAPKLTSPLLEQLITYAKFYAERHNSEINGSNVVGFSMDFCTLNKPKADDGTPYTPTQIKAIASRLFKITPGA